MTNLFIFHGSNASPDAHWFPWLAEKLEKHVDKTICLQMPGHHHQTLKNWLKTLEPHKKELEGAILVGHSLGAPFILDVLNEWNVKVKAAFLVAGFVGPLEYSGEDNLSDFSDKDFDWKKIGSRCRSFHVIHSDTDEIVPIERGREVAKKLGVNLTLVPDGGHFCGRDGWTEFPGLLMDIQKVLEE